MSLRLYANNEIQLDGKATGLHLSQGRFGTEVYSPSRAGQPYRKHAMPAERYSTTSDLTKPGTAGVSQLEEDLRALLEQLKNDGV